MICLLYDMLFSDMPFNGMLFDGILYWYEVGDDGAFIR